jgi:hypothetical protein
MILTRTEEGREMTVNGRSTHPPRSLIATRLIALAMLLATVTISGGCATGRAITTTTDERHAWISRKIADIVDATDKAFGESRIEDREEIVRAKIGIKATSRQRESTKWSVPINLRVPLPALERRWNIFLDITADPDTGNLGDIDAATRERDTTVSATLLSRLTDNFDLGTTLAVRAWNDVGPEIFVRYDRRWEPWILFGEQRGYWRTDDGWGGRTQLNLDYRLPGEAFVRFANQADYFQELQDVDLKSGFFYRRPFFLETMLSAETGIEYNPYHGDPTKDNVTDSESDDDQAYARVRMVGKIWRPWFEWQVMPGYYYQWEHEKPWGWGIELRLSIIYEAYLRER